MKAPSLRWHHFDDVHEAHGRLPLTSLAETAATRLLERLPYVSRKEIEYMSVEIVKRFMHTAEDNPSIQRQLQAVPKGGQLTIGEFVKIGAKAGFTFTEQDYEDAVSEMLSAKHAAGALNDTELALISGGLMCVSSDGTHCLCCPNPTPNPGTQHP
jgi:predicted ribosomally synthesized peptide with nif11-like leader